MFVTLVALSSRGALATRQCLLLLQFKSVHSKRSGATHFSRHLHVLSTTTHTVVLQDDFVCCRTSIPDKVSGIFFWSFAFALLPTWQFVILILAVFLHLLLLCLT